MLALHSLLLWTTLAASPDVVLLEFSSPRCSACLSLQPNIDRLVREGAPVRQINVEEDTELATRFKITHIPTCVLLVDGQEAGRLVGMRSHAELTKLLQQAAKPVEEDFVVRGQSPDAPRRGLGLFNRLGAAGKKEQDAGDPPLEIPAAPGSETPFDRRPKQPPANAVPERAAQPEAGTADVKEPITGSPAERALAATVRLKVEDATGHSFGTGTIIDTLKDEALIVTCGHIFRESKGQGKISVDLHGAGVKGPVQGQLITFDLTRDIALVSVRPGVQISAVPVAGDPRRIVEGARVFSIGCDHGAEPSVINSRITAVNKYVGSPNYTASGMPVEGRSGGGLFLADGSLIGICNAADEQDNEGLYAALPTVHWQLDLIGQTEIYRRGEGAVENIAAAPPRRDLRDANDEPPVERSELEPVRLPEMAAPAANHLAGDAEYLLIVRPLADANAPGQVYRLDSKSPEVRNLLRAQREPVIVRGQSK